MKYYLIDTSAYIHAIQNIGKTEQDFIGEKALGEAFLYIPQFCISEVLNTFARCLYHPQRQEEKLSKDQYKKFKRVFLKSVHNRRLFYVYDLHRYHNINTDKIYHYEHKKPLRRGERSHLKGFDILIIAMAMELKIIHEHDENEVCLISRDNRLLNIGEHFVKAKYFK